MAFVFVPNFAGHGNTWVGKSTDDKPANPVQGQIVYYTDSKAYYVYDGANWVAM